ncbi:MAG TPA: hypothetical protein VFU02_02925 [Polyangiaceae bacterium]|nr:hypothetical protein [Polyangiaceae bacterium]
MSSPTHSMQVDRVKYQEMRKALLEVLPKRAPGLTVAEAMTALLPRLSEEVFPGGAKAGWWLKAVQLDLEAKGVVAREPTKPLRLHRN